MIWDGSNVPAILRFFTFHSDTHLNKWQWVLIVNNVEANWDGTHNIVDWRKTDHQPIIIGIGIIDYSLFPFNTSWCSNFSFDVIWNTQFWLLFLLWKMISGCEYFFRYFNGFQWLSTMKPNCELFCKVVNILRWLRHSKFYARTKMASHLKLHVNDRSHSLLC